MKCLVVGAGATGQVIAHFLYRGGSDVSFLVKESHGHDLDKGIHLYPQRRSSLGRTEHFTQYAVHSDVQYVLEESWDAIFLCVASKGLRENFLDRLLQQGHFNTLVFLQPDIKDLEIVEQWVAKEKIVQGLLGFLAYQTPLPGMDQPPLGAVAYLLLPGVSTFFDGGVERVTEVVELLKKGGFPAKVKHDLAWVAAYRSATVIPLVAALELEQWDFEQFRDSETLALGTLAARQALDIAARYHHHINAVKYFIVPRILKMTLWSGRHLVEFELERLIKFHFTKVTSQTEFMLQSYLHLAKQYALPCDAIETLYSRWLALDHHC